MKPVNPPLQQSVAIMDHKIIISSVELSDEDLAIYLAGFSDDVRVDVTRRALKIGLLALKGSTAVEKADYVEKEFGKLSQKLDQRMEKFVKEVGDHLDRVFGEDRGVMRNVLDKYLGTGGKLEDLFDPDRKNSAIARISAILDQHFKGRDSVLYTLLDPSNPESPLAHLKADLVEHYLKEMRDRLIGKELAAKEREKGTAKGREYQESVFAKINEICQPFGDIPNYVADHVGKLPKSKVGDIVVDINPSYTSGSPLRIVIEAKDEYNYNVDKIIKELEVAKGNRDAHVALMAFKPDCCPSICYPLQQYGDDKLICTCGEDEQSDLSLGLAYRLCRIEALRKLRGAVPQIDISRLHSLVTQCLEKLKAISSIKAKVTRWSNDVNQDLDNLYTDLDGLFHELDSVTTEPVSDQ
jgi:hypothetical protein